MRVSGAGGNQRGAQHRPSAAGRSSKCSTSNAPAVARKASFCADNLDSLEKKDQIKFVIVDENDYRYARDFMLQHDLHRRR